MYLFDKFITGFIGGVIIGGLGVCMLYTLGMVARAIYDNPVSLYFIVPVLVIGVAFGYYNVQSYKKMEGDN